MLKGDIATGLLDLASTKIILLLVYIFNLYQRIHSTHVIPEKIHFIATHMLQ